MTIDPDQLPMLYGRRKRLEQIESAESQGHSFWTDSLDDQARYRLHYEVQMFAMRSQNNRIIATARNMTVIDLGLPHLSSALNSTHVDGLQAPLEAEDHVVFSFIEALIHFANSDREPTLPDLIIGVRTILREHRIRLDLVDGRFIPFESRVMHEEIVVPTLSLLGGHQSFKRVEMAYRQALEEIHNGTPDDAITDVSTALQEALITLGCTGNSLGPLAKSAQSNRILSGYDRKLIDWVSADRSNKGDAHNVEPASIEDAWLVVHVVGALILRMMGGPLRGIGTSR